jgi:hypothetical protein
MGIILDFAMYAIQHCFICRPLDSTVSEDAEIEPRSVATLALTAMGTVTTRLDLIRFLLLLWTAAEENNKLRDNNTKILFTSVPFLAQ